MATFRLVDGTGEEADLSVELSFPAFLPKGYVIPEGKAVTFQVFFPKVDWEGLGNAPIIVNRHGGRSIALPGTGVSDSAWFKGHGTTTEAVNALLEWAYDHIGGGRTIEIDRLPSLWARHCAWLKKLAESISFG